MRSTGTGRLISLPLSLVAMQIFIPETGVGVFLFWPPSQRYQDNLSPTKYLFKLVFYSCIDR